MRPSTEEIKNNNITYPDVLSVNLYVIILFSASWYVLGILAFFCSVVVFFSLIKLELFKN